MSDDNKIISGNSSEQIIKHEIISTFRIIRIKIASLLYEVAIAALILFLGLLFLGLTIEGMKEAFPNSSLLNIPIVDAILRIIFGIISLPSLVYGFIRLMSSFNVGNIKTGLNIDSVEEKNMQHIFKQIYQYGSENIMLKILILMNPALFREQKITSFDDFSNKYYNGIIDIQKNIIELINLKAEQWCEGKKIEKWPYFVFEAISTYFIAPRGLIAADTAPDTSGHSYTDTIDEVAIVDNSTNEKTVSYIISVKYNSEPIGYIKIEISFILINNRWYINSWPFDNIDYSNKKPNLNCNPPEK